MGWRAGVHIPLAIQRISWCAIFRLYFLFKNLIKKPKIKIPYGWVVVTSHEWGTGSPSVPSADTLFPAAALWSLLAPLLKARTAAPPRWTYRKCPAPANKTWEKEKTQSKKVPEYNAYMFRLAVLFGVESPPRFQVSRRPEQIFFWNCPECGFVHFAWPVYPVSTIWCYHHHASLLVWCSDGVRILPNAVLRAKTEITGNFM